MNRKPFENVHREGLPSRTLANLNGERFCSNYTLIIRVGQDSNLVYSSANRPARIVPNYVAALLNRCRAFKTLEEHSLECARALGGRVDETAAAGTNSIKKHLTELLGTGLLISETAVLDVCRQSEETPTSIATVGVITRDRIDSLECCLRSFVENGKKYARNNDFAVMDDSENLENRTATKEMLAQLKRHYDVKISYAGIEEKD